MRRTSSAGEAREGISLFLTDETGEPVTAPRLRINPHLQGGEINPRRVESDLIPDSKGLIRVTDRKKLEETLACDPLVPVYLWDSNERAAAVQLSVKDWGKSLGVTLEPTCRVNLALTSSVVASQGKSLNIFKVVVALPGNKFLHLLSSTFKAPEPVQLRLPPGDYHLNCFAGDENLILTNKGFLIPIRVFTGARELNLGLVDLPAAEKPRAWAYSSGSN